MRIFISFLAVAVYWHHNQREPPWPKHAVDLRQGGPVVRNMFQHVAADQKIKTICFVCEVRQVLLRGIGVIIVSIDAKVANAGLPQQCVLDTGLWRHMKDVAYMAECVGRLVEMKP